MFSVEQLDRRGVGEDGLRRWWVRLPHLSYDGKALAPAAWTADQVVEALNELASKASLEVMAARLYSPVRLDRPL